MIPEELGSTPAPARHLRITAPCLTAVLAVAAAVRLPRVLADDFPINDGGFFLVMVGELASGKLGLPLTTSFNDAGIPFAYPPLALYVAAALHLATGVSVLTLLRFLPVAANLGAIVVCFFLARSLLGTLRRAALATVILALLPRSYEYLIMGGGLPRSFGFLFACLAVACGHRLLVERRGSAGLPAAVSLGAAALSHPEMGLWAAASVALVAIAGGVSRRTAMAAGAVAVGAAAVASPWWVVTLARHGVAPLLAASDTSSWGVQPLLGLLSRGVAGEIGLAPLTIAAFAGVLDAVARRQLFLPAWLVLTFAVVPRSAPTAAAVPVAMLAARSLANVVVPRLERLAERLRSAHRGPSAGRGPGGVPRPRPVLAALVVIPLLGYTLIVSNLRRSPASWPSLRRVPPAEREAMAWVAANVATDRRFVVVSGVGSWWVDPVNSWFPALARRVSVATPNGTEWLPGGEFRRRVQAYEALNRFTTLDAASLAAWSERFGVEFTHVYVSKPAVTAAAVSPDALAAIGAFVAYDGPGATVLAKREPGEDPAPQAAADDRERDERAH